MSVWRQKAIECAPELRKEFEAHDLTPYTVFMELLPITRKAHKEKDYNRLKKIYDFAEWCHKQKDKNLWNAVGVTFYEHLADTDETYLQITKWIKKEIYLDIRELLNQRVDNEKIKSLDEYYIIKACKYK
ncbi:MAG: hypothetical protein U0W24_26500 [Bacteroidales bacterium]